MGYPGKWNQEKLRPVTWWPNFGSYPPALAQKLRRERRRRCPCVWLVWLRIEGPGLDGLDSICQGSPSIFPKGHLRAAPFSVEKIEAEAGPDPPAPGRAGAQPWALGASARRCPKRHRGVSFGFP